MMASGKEDGLAMALAQNMMESRKKDANLQAMERELKRLRLLTKDGRRDPNPHPNVAKDAKDAPLEPAPPKENKPMATAGGGDVGRAVLAGPTAAPIARPRVATSGTTARGGSRGSGVR